MLPRLGAAAAWPVPSLRRRFAGGEDSGAGAAAGGGSCCEDEEGFQRFRPPPRRRRLRPPAADSCGCGGSMGTRGGLREGSPGSRLQQVVWLTLWPTIAERGPQTSLLRPGPSP